jgi:hypothetical protein
VVKVLPACFALADDNTWRSDCRGLVSGSCSYHNVYLDHQLVTTPAMSCIHHATAPQDKTCRGRFQLWNPCA